MAKALSFQQEVQENVFPSYGKTIPSSTIYTQVVKLELMVNIQMNLFWCLWRVDYRLYGFFGNEWSCVIQSSSGGKIFTAITSNGNASLSGHVILGDEVTDTISATGPLTAHSSLEVKSSSTLKGNVFMHGTVAIENSDMILRSLSDAQNAKEFRFEKSRSTGSISVTEGDVLGKISWYGSNGTSSELAATIVAEVDGSHTNENENVPGRIIFSTSSYNLQQAERFKLSSNATVLTLSNNSRDAFSCKSKMKTFLLLV